VNVSTPPSRLALCVLAVVVCLVTTSGAARAQAWRDESGGMPNTTPAELQGVDIVEHLGGALPADVALRDSDGKAVRLGDYFDGKRPTLLVFAYHTCPMLCSLVLDATVRALREVPWTVGDQFDVVSISIDPNDTPHSADQKRSQVAAAYARPKAGARGFHFLVGAEAEIRRVTEAVGFEYRYDARQKQYAHPAAIYLLTPEGRIARYLYGIQYDPADVRLGLLEASEGRAVTTTERLLLFCYHYDPQGRHYSLVAMNVMRLGGGVTVAILGSLLVILWARERRRQRATHASEHPKHAKTAETSP
jgi:protein SCO1/2